jgi:hypothetical protein
MRLALAVAAAAVALVSPAAAEPMPSGQVAALTAGDTFEFRGLARTRIAQGAVRRGRPPGGAPRKSVVTRP